MKGNSIGWRKVNFRWCNTNNVWHQYQRN